MSLLDRSCHPRFPFHSRAVIAVDGREFQGTLLDISARGCLFATDAGVGFAPGHACRVAVRPAPRRAARDFGGVLAHRHEHLLGIEFVAVDAEGHQALHEILDMNLAPPHLLERELPALLR